MRRSATAVRSHSRTDVARHACNVGRARPRADRGDAPYRLGRLVQRAVLPRARHLLQRVFVGNHAEAVTAAPAICGLHGMAARISAGPIFGEPALLLERANGAGTSAVQVSQYYRGR